MALFTVTTAACSLLLADDLKSGPTVVVVERDGQASAQDAASETSTPPAPDDASTLDPDLVAWWRFDETSGLQSTDLTGHGHTAFLGGDATFTQVETHANGAVLFDGGGFVDVPSLYNTAFPSTGTASIWFRWTTMVAADHIGILDRFDDSRAHLFLRHANGDTVGVFQLALEPGNANTYAFETGFPVPARTWTHVVFTWDQTTSRGACYRDGVLVATAGFEIPFLPSAQIFKLGIDLHGAIDEVMLFKRALTTAEASALP